MTDHEKKHDSDRAFRLLLERSYEPPTYREDFKSGLLGKLKERQQEVAARQRLARTVRFRAYFLGGFSGMAAAAALALLLTPLFSTQAISPGQANMDKPLLAQDDRPRRVISSGIEEPANPAELAAVTEEKQPSAVRYRIEGSDEWQALADEDSAFPVNARTVFAVPAEAKQSGGVKTSGGIVMVMDPGSELTCDRDTLAMNTGNAYVFVPKDHAPFSLALPEYNVSVEPGSRIYLRMNRDGKYVAGQEPAPEVMVVDGLAFSDSDRGTGPMFPGYSYKLDRYVTPDLPGKKFSSSSATKLRETGGGSRLFLADGSSWSKRAPAQSVFSELTRDGDTAAFDNRSFRYEDGRWFDSTYVDGTPTVKIRYLSTEYNSFLKENRALVPALSLGRNVIVGKDGAFYEIHE